MAQSTSKQKATATLVTKWPSPPSAGDYDSHTLWQTGQGVPQDLVIGKVVMRIPYFGWITLFLRNNAWGLPVVIGLILLLVVFEFVIPLIKDKTKKPEDTEKKSSNEEPSTLPGQQDIKEVA